ncbi:glycoside hydrolase family 28 protein [Agrobacterium rubi]|uniref:polygalacturonase PglB n=1 Tax=Agrobacterium rubi TaxID=28099 RepID=UPI001571D5D6|nr:glycosyl hydrolase family 28 protein [Agrobacterium rubi]NTF08982.1 glycoside hydrolase family 28 protein [Agrobacterium rubi]NTF21253.1 glycoside hydrolase family 28 protein [Agrobacterium rubi]NTF28110.1 glycoside hydrolase family 28 protein [Agrobacterium rubi]
MTSPSAIRIAPQQEVLTTRLQSLFDTHQGHLHVVLEPGIHQCGGLRLPSDVTIEIVKGAELHFVPDYEAYAQTTVAIVAEESDRAMMTAVCEKNITLCGEGRIFCAGSTHYSHGVDGDMGTLVAHRYRPRILVLDGCRDIRIEDLRIDDSPMWTMHFAACENIDVKRVSVDNDRRMPNTDGIVIDGCRNVAITDSTFRTADDGIVLKTTRREDGSLTGPCENISVKNCVVESLSCALKLGTESFSPFRNIAFEDVKIEKSNRGLGIFSRDGGLVENIRFVRISVDCHETPAGYWGSGEAITITVLDRRPEEFPAGVVRNVLIEDITGSMEGAINMVAEHDGGISDIVLRRIAIEQKAGPLKTGLSYDIRPTIEDRFDRFPIGDKSAGRVNAWRFGPDGEIIGLIEYPGGIPGIFTKGVSGLKTDDIAISRPDPLPQNWNPEIVVVTNAAD